MGNEVDNAGQPINGQRIVQKDPPKKLASIPLMLEGARELIEIGPDNPSMQEAHFIDFLRAAFNSETGDFDTKLWYHVFGSFRNGVDVTDSTGTLLYRTPPIVSVVHTRSGTRRSKEGTTSPSMAQIADNAALQGRRHPALEVRAMESGLADYQVEIGYDVRAGWREILNKYNLIKNDSSESKGLSPKDLLSVDGEDL